MKRKIVPVILKSIKHLNLKKKEREKTGRKETLGAHTTKTMKEKTEQITLRALRDLKRIASSASGCNSRYSVRCSCTDCSTTLRTSGLPNLVCP